jgi:hypothetical protein
MPPITHVVPVGSQFVAPNSNPSSVTVATLPLGRMPTPESPRARPTETIPPLTQAPASPPQLDAPTAPPPEYATGPSVPESGGLSVPPSWDASLPLGPPSPEASVSSGLPESERSPVWAPPSPFEGPTGWSSMPRMELHPALARTIATSGGKRGSRKRERLSVEAKRAQWEPAIRTGGGQDHRRRYRTFAGTRHLHANQVRGGQFSRGSYVATVREGRKRWPSRVRALTEVRVAPEVGLRLRR